MPASDTLTTGLLDALKDAYDVTDMEADWQLPQDSAHGDRATSVALRLAKRVGKPPREIAETLAAALAGKPGIAKAEVAGAGYVNVWLTPAALLASLADAQAACKPQPVRGKEPVVIDYPSPNIAKPLGVHHILVSMIGQSLANLYRHAGTPVVGWNYIGDWGTQFGKLAVGHAKWGTKPVADCTIDDLLALYVQFHDEAEKTPELENEGRAAFRKLEEGDEDLRAFLDTVTEVTMREMQSVFDRLGVRFDVTRGERYYEGKMAAIVKEGKEKGVFTEGEKGALIVQFPEESGLPPAIVLKSDGTTIYLTRDLALMRDRIDGWKPSAILHVVGVPQSLYFQQLFATAGMLGWELPKLEHVSFGQMRFTDRKMSTRKGNILKLEEVLDEAVRRATDVIRGRGDAIQTDDPADLAEMMGIGAVVYGVLSQSRKSDIVFDWDKMLSFEGNSAPYLQYTFARARSVLRKAETEPELPEDAPGLSDAERSLIRELALFPRALEDARREHMPHKLANQLYALAQAFNTFYNAAPILKSEGPARTVRLALVSLTAAVLRAGAGILTLRLPERM